MCQIQSSFTIPFPKINPISGKTDISNILSLPPTHSRYRQLFQLDGHKFTAILRTQGFFFQFPGTLQFLSSLRRLWISVLETAPSSSTCWRDFNIKKRGHNFTSKDSAQWSERNSICIKSCHWIIHDFEWFKIWCLNIFYKFALKTLNRANIKNRVYFFSGKFRC